MASLGGFCSFTNSGKPMANHRRKKARGTPMKSSSWMALGSTVGVAWFSERRRYLTKK